MKEDGNFENICLFAQKNWEINMKHTLEKSRRKKTARAVRSGGGRGMSRIPALSLVMNSPWAESEKQSETFDFFSDFNSGVRLFSLSFLVQTLLIFSNTI